MKLDGSKLAIFSCGLDDRSSICSSLDSPVSPTPGVGIIYCLHPPPPPTPGLGIIYCLPPTPGIGIIYCLPLSWGGYNLLSPPTPGVGIIYCLPPLLG